MVVLDQHSVRKVLAMVLSPAATDSILIQRTQARNGFAGVQNARLGALDRLYILPRHGGNPAEPLQNVENHALAGKQRARIMPHHRDGLAFVQTHSIKDLSMTDDLSVADSVLV